MALPNLSELQDELQKSSSSSYLPTPDPSVRSHSAPPEPEDELEPDIEDQLQQQLLSEQKVDQDDSISTIVVASQPYGPLTPARSEGTQRRRGRPPTGKSILSKGWEDSREYTPDRKENNAPARTDPTVGSTSNIVTGKRARKPPNYALAAYHEAFAAVTNPTALSKLNGEVPRTQLYRDQLPDPPKRWKDLQNHLFSDEFVHAARIELNSY